jgi:hypothetical protein
MSEKVPVVGAQRSAAGRLLPESPTTEQPKPWITYVRRLEASRPLNFVPTGGELTFGSVYLDLHQPCRGPFVALRGQTAGSRNRYLAQEDVPPAVWHAIIEHCACVDAETGVLGATHHIPCNRLPALYDGTSGTRLFAA